MWHDNDIMVWGRDTNLLQLLVTACQSRKGDTERVEKTASIKVEFLIICRPTCNCEDISIKVDRTMTPTLWAGDSMESFDK